MANDYNDTTWSTDSLTKATATSSTVNNVTLGGTLAVTGVISPTTHIDMPDSANIKLGTGDDLQLYHDGSNSYITNSTGALKLATESSGIAITIGHTTSEVTIGENLTVTGTLTLGSGAELTEAELEMLDGITAGTAAASKALVLDSSKNIATIGTIGCGAITSTGSSSFGATSFGDNDITNVGSIFCDTISGDIDSNTGIAFEGSDIIKFMCNSANQVNIHDGSILPYANNDIDLGSGSYQFKDAFFDGTITTDGLTVSSTTNLDGAIQVDNTITVGVDGTGYDVKFFGTTSGKYMLWDEDQDDLVLVARNATLDNSGNLTIPGSLTAKEQVNICSYMSADFDTTENFISLQGYGTVSTTPQLGHNYTFPCNGVLRYVYFIANDWNPNDSSNTQSWKCYRYRPDGSTNTGAFDTTGNWTALETISKNNASLQAEGRGIFVDFTDATCAFNKGDMMGISMTNSVDVTDVVLDQISIVVAIELDWNNPLTANI